MQCLAKASLARPATIDLPKLPKNFFERLNKQGDSIFFVEARAPFSLTEVQPGKPAAQAGLKVGDRITQIGSTPIRYFDELLTTLHGHKSQTLPITVQRGGQAITLPVAVSKQGTIGVRPTPELKFGKHYFNLGQSVPLGAKEAGGVISNYLTVFGKIGKGEVAFGDVMGGPVEITQQFSGTWDWKRFWVLTASLSMSLAFMNLLPIPALDGGHVLFLLYEIILRRKPSDKFLESAQRIGTLLILGLMFYVIVVKQILKFF